jgi:hypothetical protein
MYSNDIAPIHIVDDANAGARDPTGFIRSRFLTERWCRAEVTERAGQTDGGRRTCAERCPEKWTCGHGYDTCKSRPAFGPERISAKVICEEQPASLDPSRDSGGALTSRTPPKVVDVSWGRSAQWRRAARRVYADRNFRDWIKQAMLLDLSKDALP